MAKEQAQEEKKPVEKKNQTEEKAQLIKKWKGKDWYSILAPKFFGESFLAESPATDPKSLMGRVVPIIASDLTGDKTKNYMKLFFKVSDVKQFPRDSFPTQEIYGNIDYAGVRLITCGGVFNRQTHQYSHNTVVYASLVN